MLVSFVLDLSIMIYDVNYDIMVFLPFLSHLKF